MNFLDNVRASLRNNPAAVLPTALIALLLLGNVVFAIAVVLPQWTAHEDLALQVDTGKKTLDARLAQQNSQDDAKVLQSQIDSAQDKLETASTIFLTQAQVDELLSKVYRYAEDNDVKIISLQAQQASGKAADPKATTLYDQRVFRLQIDGNIINLMNFLSQFREASLPGVSLTGLSVNRGKNQTDSMTMGLVMLVSPYANGDAFAELPQSNIRIVVLPSPTPTQPTATPTATLPPTATPHPVTPTPLPPTATDAPATPTLDPFVTMAAETSVAAGLAPTPTPAGQCAPQDAQAMRKLVFSQPQESATICQPQSWTFTLDKPYDYVLDVERRSGNGQFRMELRDGNNALIDSAFSSIDGRGLLVATSDVGNYTLTITPLTATGTWVYSVAIWKGLPSLSFTLTQNSYSSHTSLEGKRNIMNWRYTLNGGPQTYRIEVTRTDGNLEYDMIVSDSNDRPVATTKSSGGSAVIMLTTARGAYTVQILVANGTSGSYRIGLVK
ncbi:MAG: hypothetical protein IT324_03170 [Anaerolineae bacterium]|nr:hypothetical protein [Anaerolineae bacterium]